MGFAIDVPPRIRTLDYLSRKPKKAGKIYRQIAEKCISAWVPQMSDSKRKILLEEGNFDKLEEIAHARDSVESAIHAVRRELAKRGIYLPIMLVDIIFWSEKPEEELKETIEEIAECNFSEVEKGDLGFRAIAAVHDRWVLWNWNKFFLKSRVSKQYMFLRTELISFDEALKDYMFAEDVLEILGLGTDESYIRHAFETARRRYKEHYKIRNSRDLAEHIKNTAYPVLSREIMDAMKYDDVAERIAKQVVLKGGSPELW
ncbi:hypothetical protein IKG02_03535 [Candidatus Saccharibacteria bacterium]|nr:hypothetical protein [Candidatus Saccharibacteria bacterium]